MICWHMLIYAVKNRNTFRMKKVVVLFENTHTAINVFQCTCPCYKISITLQMSILRSNSVYVRGEGIALVTLQCSHLLLMVLA